jgi:hypothetical protein
VFLIHVGMSGVVQRRRGRKQDAAHSRKMRYLFGFLLFKIYLLKVECLLPVKRFGQCCELKPYRIMHFTKFYVLSMNIDPIVLLSIL